MIRKNNNLFLHLILISFFAISCKVSEVTPKVTSPQVTKPTPPLTPKNLKAVDTADYSITLTWDAVLMVDKYKLYRTDKLVYEGSDNTFKDQYLSPATSYTYTISAQNSNGESIKSDAYIAKTANKLIGLGNPSNATSNESNLTNYYISRPQFAISYNNNLKHANWVTWDLDSTWFGSAKRLNNFIPDNTLPVGFDRVTPNEYLNTGFDRGHMCPSADRTRSQKDNDITFIMTNITPQAPAINRGTFADFEEYCRDIIKHGYKAQIITGAIGTGGTGDKGVANIIGNNINVPNMFYKVVVFTKMNQPIDENSIVVNIMFPNSEQEHISKTWNSYLTTTEVIEKQIKSTPKQVPVDFFKNVPVVLQNKLKNYNYNFEENPFGIDLFVKYYSVGSGTNTTIYKLYVGPKGGCYYVRPNGNKTYVDRSECVKR